MEFGLPRHTIEQKAGVEQLRLPARRNWFVVSFLTLWLTVWIWGGIAAVSRPFEPALVVWLAFSMITCGSAAIIVAGHLAGVDTLTAEMNQLTVARGVGPIVRTWTYQTHLIRNLHINMIPWSGDGGDATAHMFFLKHQWGTVRFAYGAETIHLAPQIDEPEAEQIMAWLKRRLPASACPKTP